MARLQRWSPRRGARLAAALIALSTLRAPAARADASDRVAAEALFDEGKRLMDASAFGAACSKLEASQRLDPAAGTLLVLGHCYEKAGRLASAWEAFREAAAASRAGGNAIRENEARERVAALEHRLSRLEIDATAGSDLRVARNGVDLDPALLGVAIPVDGGTHVVTAEAPGKKRWTRTLQVATAEDVVVVTVPPLEPEGPAPHDESRGRSASGGDGRRTLALVVGGVGAAGLAVGTVFGVMASSAWSEAKSHCDPAPYCGPEGHRLSRVALQRADLATVAFVVGGLGVVGGAVLWLTAPGPGSTSTVVGLGPASVTLKGAF